MPVPHIARAPDLGDFKVEGARPFFAYADTGLAASTGGRSERLSCALCAR